MLAALVHGRTPARGAADVAPLGRARDRDPRRLRGAPVGRLAGHASWFPPGLLVAYGLALAPTLDRACARHREVRDLRRATSSSCLAGESRPRRTVRARPGPRGMARRLCAATPPVVRRRRPAGHWRRGPEGLYGPRATRTCSAPSCSSWGSFSVIPARSSEYPGPARRRLGRDRRPARRHAARASIVGGPRGGGRRLSPAPGSGSVAVGVCVLVVVGRGLLISAPDASSFRT